MKRVVSLFTLGLFALIGLSVASPSQAGDKKKEVGGPPKVELGPEHKFLKSLEGNFDVYPVLA